MQLCRMPELLVNEAQYDTVNNKSDSFLQGNSKFNKCSFMQVVDRNCFQLIMPSITLDEWGRNL